MVRHIESGGGGGSGGGGMTTRTRYVVLFLGSACIASICSNMTTLNFTFICMGKDPSESNSTAPRGDYDYNAEERNALITAVGVGTLVAALPFQLLYDRFNARTVFFVAGVISTLSTAVIPFIAAIPHLPYFIAARFLQGISFGADFGAIGLITVHWASLKQHGLFIGLLTSFSQISVMFTMPVAGELCESKFGWSSVYYVHAALSGVLFLGWILYYRNNPAKHPLMTDIELEKIQRDKGDNHGYKKEATPYKAILRNPVMWTVWYSAFGELMMSQFISIFGAIYINKVLHFGVAHTGYFVAIPRFIHLLSKIGSGIASDRIKFIGERPKMIIFNSIALMVSGILFCVLGFVQPEHAQYALVLLLIIEFSTGFICGGFYKCATLVARQHSSFVLSNIQFIKCIALFLEPQLVYLFCKHNTVEEWRIVFLIHGGLLITGNLVFCLLATDQPADFTYSAEQLDARQRKHVNGRSNGRSNGDYHAVPQQPRSD